MTEKRLLLTCFEPFGGREHNASRDALAALPDAVGGYTLHKLCLPVVFGAAAERALAAASALRPDAIVCVGEAAGRAAITPELVAINLQYARIPDNLGNAPMDAPCVAGGENALFATLPVRRMARAVCDAGLPGEVSYSAGAYVCNDLFYRVLHRYRDAAVRCGFIHVPAGDAWRAEDLAAGLAACIRAL
ncbi:MAG: pyroglutamyl-peptidase I [Ruminococcaceae bacterium]|nr:pyroglutamyl-peptidase I [Oscillospiraceae bacterium]